MALFRLYKKQWESGFRLSHALTHPQSINKANDDPAGEVYALPRSSPSSPPSPKRSRKREHSESSMFDDDGVNKVAEALSSSSGPRARSLSPSSARTQSPTQHISTLPKRSKQKSRSQPPADSAQRKGISSGILTVTRKAGGVKEIRRNGTRTGDEGEKGTVAGNTSKGGKKTSKVGEKWWKRLGGSKKGSIKP